MGVDGQSLAVQEWHIGIVARRWLQGPCNPLAVYRQSDNKELTKWFNQSAQSHDGKHILNSFLPFSQDMVQSLVLSRTSASTVTRVTIDGKAGHVGYRSTRGYGNLFVDYADNTGTVHGMSCRL